MSSLEQCIARTARSALVGSDIEVPLVLGGTRRYINLDYAASTPALSDVAEAVEAFLPWYSSIHRGAGFKSTVATAAYEGAREAVRQFFHARLSDATIFVRNTTDATNLLASALPRDTEVLAFETEHHANMLPWRRGSLGARYLPAPSSPEEALLALERVLRRSSGRNRLVAISGASNVTGEVWPLREAVALAHHYDARAFVDGAQLAGHYPVDVQALDADYLAVSAHKMYAPFGAGALIGRVDWLEGAWPYLRGGGAVEFVTLDSVLWSALPERHEAGSPNVVGAVAMGAACRSLARLGMDHIAQDELELATYARRRIGALPGIELYGLWESGTPRLGIMAFNLRGYWHSHLAAILSAEYGIGVRHGCFCAHPLMLHLLHVTDEEASAIRRDIGKGNRARVPGAVRVSMGLGTTRDDVEQLCQALEAIITVGPQWAYHVDPSSGEYLPDPDTRQWPVLPVALAVESAGREESS